MFKLHIDLESFSSVDIKKYGAYKYVDSPDFEILLFAYALHTDPVVVLDMHIPSERAEAERIAAHWLNHLNYQKYAHNATFEILCLTKYFKLDLDLKQWRCTAVIAAELGLPRALGELTAYMKFDETKAKKSTGMALIRYFCCPVKPSAVNNGRTRNRPSDDPVRWQEFKEYCAMDVEAEREVDRRLSSLPVTDDEWAMWRLDHEINVRGMKVDIPFVEAAIDLGEEMKDKFFAEAVLLTGLTNPNSVGELKKWMEKEIEEELPDMTKGTIKKLLKKTQPGDADRMLVLRQELSKTSLKKFDALKGAVCSDGRIKGTLLFYGAQRTGRWAGRVFQPQNLPQNHLSDLEGARWLVEHADTAAIEMIYDSVSDTLSQLIRTAIVPKEGKKFIVVDFSAVEARNIAWYADEEWRLEVFRTHGKIYEASAAAAFHVPMASIDKHSKYRQYGKVLELACLAEGTQVLTDKGLVDIEDVHCGMRVWDGVEWVKHQGVIFKGYREVITYEGITATTDHTVWTESGAYTLGYAAKEKLKLVRSGTSRTPIWVGDNPRRRTGKVTSWLQGVRSVYGVWRGKMGLLSPFIIRKIERLSELFSAPLRLRRPSEEDVFSEDSLHKSERPQLSQIWWERDRVQIQQRERCLPLGYREHWALKWFATRQDRQQRPLRAREFKVADCEAECEQQERHEASERFQTIRMAIFRKNSEELYRDGADSERDHLEGEEHHPKKREQVVDSTTKVAVYDILNAGPRHRFTANGVLVHNCGYGGGAGAVGAMDRDGAIPEKDRKPMVYAWREASPKIVQMWWDIGGAAEKAVRNPRMLVTTKYQGVSFIHEKGFLFMNLPSGRRLAYPKPLMMPNPRFGGEMITFEGKNQYTNKWERLDTYGPKLVENMVQATCRDLLAYGMMELDKEGYKTVMHVHDEAVVECDPSTSVEEIEKILARKPDWASTMPHRADGFETYFYKKD